MKQEHLGREAQESPAFRRGEEVNLAPGHVASLISEWRGERTFERLTIGSGLSVEVWRELAYDRRQDPVTAALVRQVGQGLGCSPRVVLEAFAADVGVSPGQLLGLIREGWRGPVG